MDQSSKHIFGDLVVTGNLQVGSDIAGTGEVTVTGALVSGDQTVDTLTIDATPGAHAAAPDLAFGDGDTGLYESADDVLKVTTAGTVRATIDSNGIAVVGKVSTTANQGILAAATPGALAAAPTIALGDGDTGFYETADDAMWIVTAGGGRVYIDNSSVQTTVALTCGSILKTVIAPGAFAATPVLALGDGDTGFWESVDDVLKVGTAGVERASFDSNGLKLVVPTYADNAAAVSGGLAVNQLYKTAAGELRIVV